MDFEQQVAVVLAEVEGMLLEKNKTYGNSALDPVRCFSKLNSEAGLRVRIDDKLSRLMRGEDYPGDDDVFDLLGYLVLLRIAQKKKPREELPP